MEHRLLLDFHGFSPWIGGAGTHMSLGDPWPNRGEPLNELLAVYRVIETEHEIDGRDIL